MAFLYPTEKGKDERVSQYFGQRPEVYKKFGTDGHNGLDLSVPTGTTILSIGDGTVLVTGDEGPRVGYGKYVKIQHDGYVSYYAHLKDFLVRSGDKVIAGQKIAISNNTGFSSGAHLHLTIKATDSKGNVLNYNNGFKGAIDPLTLLEVMPHELPPAVPHYAADEEAFFMKLYGVSKKNLDEPMARGEAYVLLKHLYDDHNKI